MNLGIFEELDEEQKLNEGRKAQQQKLKNAINTVMGMKEGRYMVAWILGVTELDESTTSLNPMAMMQRSARRDVGLEILQTLRDVCPELLQTLLAEKD